MRRADKFQLLRKTELCRHFMAGYCPRSRGPHRHFPLMSCGSRVCLANSPAAGAGRCRAAVRVLTRRELPPVLDCIPTSRCLAAALEPVSPPAPRRPVLRVEGTLLYRASGASLRSG